MQTGLHKKFLQPTLWMLNKLSSIYMYKYHMTFKESYNLLK